MTYLSKENLLIHEMNYVKAELKVLKKMKINYNIIIKEMKIKLQKINNITQKHKYELNI